MTPCLLIINAALFGIAELATTADLAVLHGQPQTIRFFTSEDAPVTVGLLIFERVLAMLINEAVEAVFMRVASAEDIDLAMTKGVNYPKGLLAWANELGLPRVLGWLERLQADYGEDRYRPSPLLRRMARDGRRFFE